MENPMEKHPAMRGVVVVMSIEIERGMRISRAW